MGYTSHVFEDGKVLHASQLNNIVNSIDDVYEAMGYNVEQKVDASNATPINFTTTINGYYTAEHHASGYGQLISDMNNRFAYSSVFELRAGQTVVIYSCFNHNVAGLLQTDSSGKPVGTRALLTGDPALNQYIAATRYYTASEDMYCVACNRYDILPLDEWTISIANNVNTWEEKTIIPLQTTIQSLVNTTSIDTTRPNEPRKAVVCFTFDDGLATDDTVYSIFKEKGMVCNFALPTSASARYGKYLQYQNEGFEILSHSTDGSAMRENTTAASTIEGKFKNSKTSLENAGFNITAWVTPSSQMHDDYVPYLRKYYDLGFTVYLGDWDEDASGSQIPYNVLTDDLHRLWRVSMESTTLDRVKVAIDEAVANTGYMNFYAHDFTRGLTQDNLRAILDYVQTYIDAGKCIVTTVTKGYIHYYTLRHSDLFGLLSSTSASE